MTTPSVLGPNGTPYVELGGSRAWRVFHKGDIVASLQWIDVQATDPDFPEAGPVPCMALFHAHRRATTGAHVIPQRFAYLYGAKEGKPTPYFYNCIRNACETLGFDRMDKAAGFRIMDVVLEAMPDLIYMSCEQPKTLEVTKQKMGIEATVLVNGQRQHEESV
jgi:hypothetical protein